MITKDFLLEMIENTSIVIGLVSIPPDILVRHFTSIFFTPDEPLSFIDPSWKFYSNTTDTVFTDAELEAALTKLNGNAAPGPQLIPSRVIKEVFASNATRAPLLALMNLCFVTGQTPKSWGESEVFILYKGTETEIWSIPIARVK
jgi:hypothetical protein